MSHWGGNANLLRFALPAVGLGLLLLWVEFCSGLVLLTLVTTLLPAVVLYLMHSIERRAQWRDEDSVRLQVVRLTVVLSTLVVGAVVFAWVYGLRGSLGGDTRTILTVVLWLGVVSYLPLVIASVEFARQLHDARRRTR